MVLCVPYILCQFALCASVRRVVLRNDLRESSIAPLAVEVFASHCCGIEGRPCQSINHCINALNKGRSLIVRVIVNRH